MVVVIYIRILKTHRIYAGDALNALNLRGSAKCYQLNLQPPRQLRHRIALLDDDDDGGDFSLYDDANLGASLFTIASEKRGPIVKAVGRKSASAWPGKRKTLRDDDDYDEDALTKSRLAARAVRPGPPGGIKI